MGYYCLANVHRDDLDALAQLKSGDSVAFQFEG
jgi:allophanate hydrolase subunit 2